MGTANGVVMVSKVLDNVVVKMFVSVKQLKANMARFSRPYLIGHIGLDKRAMGILDVGIWCVKGVLTQFIFENPKANCTTTVPQAGRDAGTIIT